ncbi:urea amidolyase associated protein UAAP1 [Patulibacter minatonensis]|uniref:urea amidolyase associated protein UAAP1 n=1 Tax=Patulibacter minatonensis TaxID=298163 RepID=UPI000688B7E1|nr:urea amidolyase associated protein UAAP1 [Patulibacter minatonensis]
MPETSEDHEPERVPRAPSQSDAASIRDARGGARTPALHSTEVPGGWTWSGVVRRGLALRLTDPTGSGTVALTALRAADTSERYCMGDTLKQQFTSRLSTGHALYSDMGRILLSIVADDVGGHDPFGGLGDDRLLTARHGAAPYQDLRNARWRSGREALETELAKHGLGRRDLGDVVNLFSVVDVAEDGTTALRAGHSHPGASVVLRAELDVLVALYAGPHPHEDVAAWAPHPVGLAIEPIAPAGPDDVVRLLRPENARGLAASELATLLGPVAA